MPFFLYTSSQFNFVLEIQGCRLNIIGMYDVCYELFILWNTIYIDTRRWWFVIEQFDMK